MLDHEQNYRVGVYTLMIGKRSKRRVNPGARGWLVLGRFVNGQPCPTIGYGVIDGTKVRVRGGAVPPSVMRKLVELARSHLIERESRP